MFPIDFGLQSWVHCRQDDLPDWTDDHWAHDVCPGSCGGDICHCHGSDGSLQDMQRKVKLTHVRVRVIETLFKCSDNQSQFRLMTDWYRACQLVEEWWITLEEKFNLSAEYCSNIEQHTEDQVYTQVEAEVNLTEGVVPLETITMGHPVIKATKNLGLRLVYI